MTKPLRACLARCRFETATNTQSRVGVSLIALALAASACAGDGSGASAQTDEHTDDTQTTHPPESDPLPAEPGFFRTNSVSQRVSLPLAAPGAILDARAL